jgi:hypothetical protein
MSRRSGSEFWEWARLAWDKPAGAVAVFILGALIYEPLPNAFVAFVRGYGRSQNQSDNPYVGMFVSGFADGTLALMPFIQGFAALVMAVAALASLKHLYRHFRPRPQPAAPSGSGQFSQIKRRRLGRAK